MLGQPALRSASGGPSAVAVFTRVGLMMLPSRLLLLAALRPTASRALPLWLSVVFQGCVCLLTFLSRRGWRQPIGPTLITLYLIALAWLWWGATGRDDW